MKEINLKKALEAWTAAETAREQRAAWEARARDTSDIMRGRWAEYAAQAAAREKEAREAFQAEAVRISAAISAEEGRATARTATAEDLAQALRDIETKLSTPKNSREGIRARIDPSAQNFPRAYKYTPQSTQFVLEYRRGAWRLCTVIRDACRREGHAVELDLTPAAEAAILDKYRAF